MEELYEQSKERGQTLVEVLVALSAIVVVLSGITVLILQSMNQSSKSSELTTASQYAQEGMEVARVQRGFQAGEYYCLGTDTSVWSAQTTPCVSPNVNKYIRQVHVESSSQCSPLVKVTVNVSWSDANCQGTAYCHTVPLTTCL